METVEYKNISFTVWDVGGQDKVYTSIFSLLSCHPCVLVSVVGFGLRDLNIQLGGGCWLCSAVWCCCADYV